jgi:hypothetical protein
MKSLLAIALCATALCGAAPTLAQPYAPPAAGAVRPGHDLREQLDTLQHRIDDGIRAGQIDRGEADRAMRELTSIREEQDRMRARTGGELSEMDRGRLQERLDGLSRSIHGMREHGPGPGAPPAAAPPVVAPPPIAGDWTLERRESWIQERIDRGRGDGTLSRHEAFRAQAALNDIRATQGRMMRHAGGRLRDSDRFYLEGRLSRLRDSIRSARDEVPPWQRN